VRPGGRGAPRGAAAPPDPVEVAGAQLRLASEKGGTFALALRLRDPPRSPVQVTSVRWKMKLGPRTFAIGFANMEPIWLAPGVQELPVFELPFAVEDPLPWKDERMYVGVSGGLEVGGPGSDYWIPFEDRLWADVTYPPPPELE
jgi:hypothetical protein